MHYLDVFDTNTPGFVWVLSLIRLMMGPSPEVLRLIDLGIVATTVVLLLKWARQAGASPAGVAWAAAAIALFYPFTYEFNHTQRDVWMMLPAVIALTMRMRRLAPATLTGDANPAGTPTTAAGVSTPLVRTTAMRYPAFWEGVIWGVGCWIKPHLFIVAAVVWLMTANRFPTRKAAFRDLAAVFAGGLVMGLAGLAWLIGTGAWSPFIDVWRNWNSAYASMIRREFGIRLAMQLDYFPPYSIFALVAVPLAVWNLRGRNSPDPIVFRRSVLAATYLTWLLTALLLQRQFNYVHVPETLFMISLFAANRWPIPFALIALQVVVVITVLTIRENEELMDSHIRTRRASWMYRQLSEYNPAFNTERLSTWSQCFDLDPPREVRKNASLWSNNSSALDPVELGAVADFLRDKQLQDGELIAWHDTPHALYLDLGIRPSFRFMHVGTVMGLGPWQRQQVLKELQEALPKARYAVSDVYRVVSWYHRINVYGEDGLPMVLPPWQREQFPFNQPVVFRSPSGRYLVHEIKNPVTDCAIPDSRSGCFCLFCPRDDF